LVDARATLTAAPPAVLPSQPFISVAIPTFNRPDDLTRCLASLARIRYPRWEVILIDQSDGDATFETATAWNALIPSIRYLRLNQKNTSAARNVAIENAGGDIVAFIDDDCTVEPEWLDSVNAAFMQGDADLIFGSVVAAEHDPHATYITTYDVPREKSFRGRLGAVSFPGMGACMYLRRGSRAPALFDVELGPGGRFRTAEDHDYAYRVLAAGGTVTQTRRIVVTHHQARPFADGSASSKVRDYGYGVGACHAKLLRSGYVTIVAVIADTLARNLVQIRPQNVLFRQPTHVGRTLMYVRGLKDGIGSRIDRARGTFALNG
jgi:glycosyltransferase involved in cell wall biosynthesis